MAGSEMGNGSASSVTEVGPLASRASIARRVASPSAEKVASIGLDLYLTIWLNINDCLAHVKVKKVLSRE